MKHWVSFVGMMLGILLMGCSAPGSSQAPKTPSEQLNSSPPVSQEPAKQGQSLPISAKATLAGKEIQLEVAKTAQQQAMGLMYRQSLADNQGMLFPFNPPQPVSFWMKNVSIPLDMVFLNKGVVQGISANVPPCPRTPCPTYGPGTIVDQVIELRGGRAAELNLKVGDSVTIEQVDTNTQSSTRSRQ